MSNEVLVETFKVVLVLFIIWKIFKWVLPDVNLSNSITFVLHEIIHGRWED